MITKERLKRKLWLAVLLSVAGTAVFAQSITGSVLSSDDGSPIAGASVQVKEGADAAMTDERGRFIITAQPGDPLIVSFVGYITQELAARDGMVVRLEPSVSDLEEVVVVGYGVQKKKLLTGANFQVSGEDIQQRNQLNPLQALQGQSPGVTILSTSGQPGADMKVTIRGLGTIGDASPLYIIDGVPGDINILNPADIESIDVLKDAASAAIYGAQAANGVVLVTTKSGASGRGQVSFDAFKGAQQIARYARLLNAEQYKVIMNEQAVNSGVAPYDFNAMEGLGDTDWLSHMFKDNANMENYSLNIGGGSETSTYALSLNYITQEGIVGGKDVSNYDRYGFRINSEHKLYKDVLKVGQHLNLNFIRNTGIAVGNQYNNTLRGAFSTSPLTPVYGDNNRFGSPYYDSSFSPWYKSDGNPYGMMMTTTNNINDAQRLMADVYAELQPIERLRIRSVLGINYYANEYRNFTPLYQFSELSYNVDHTTALQNIGKGHTITAINTASYDFLLDGGHTFGALIGMEAQRYQGTFLQGSNWNLLSQFNDFAHAYLDNTTGQAHLDDEGNIVETRQVSGRPENLYRRVSYFGRLDYNYQEKYLFNATLRADGSSRFSRGNRWGYFPSFAVGWVVTNEAFFNEAGLGWLDFLKFRGSWGQVGNQNVGDFQFAAPINTSTGYSADNPAAFYVFGTGNVNVPGAYPSRLSNPGLRWETSEQTNVGLDARLFNNRLGVVADYYVKHTKDWLVQAPVLATAGALPPFINGGSVKNTGVELALNWNDRQGEVGYSLGINGAYNKNTVGQIPTQDGIIHGQTNMLYANADEFYRAENGHPIGYFWGFKTDGIFQNQAEIDAWRDAGYGILQSDVRPGDVRYVDVNHDGVINQYDKVNLGKGMPDFTYGINLGLSYKGADFSVNAYGVAGNELVQAYRDPGTRQANYTTAILERWTGEGTSNRIPRVTETNINWRFSDLYLQDGSFLRVSNITLGYDISKLVRWSYLGQARIYFQAQNPFTFTKYDGMDPEIGYGTDGWAPGIDLGYYPRPRVLMIGTNIKF
ncbi:TonB-linked outer membrane protein, SusC/RagA family [Parapedobacter composti]|uniref:TonB-linked outer membrane protein, SusC/RagA family n=1 Tax=Parapedobacter composti TaxID=623281 RepID=A0A1I1FU50_9SPHI|nr:TonB-dependent receptor [Parapedobacter composti]SFC02572.1 TonB-linked outer membrane protein, SusC/RagA family [Parapedobacter composti]